MADFTDETRISAKWLRTRFSFKSSEELGHEPDGCGMLYLYVDVESGNTVEVAIARDGSASIYVGEDAFVPARRYKTRGDVRQLLDSLGWKPELLKGPTHAD